MNISNVPIVQLQENQPQIMEYVSRDLCNGEINKYMAHAISVTKQNTFFSILLLSTGIIILIIITAWLLCKNKKLEKQQHETQTRSLGKRKKTVKNATR